MKVVLLEFIYNWAQEFRHLEGELDLVLIVVIQEWKQLRQELLLDLLCLNIVENLDENLDDIKLNVKILIIQIVE